MLLWTLDIHVISETLIGPAFYSHALYYQRRVFLSDIQTSRSISFSPETLRNVFSLNCLEKPRGVYFRETRWARYQ